MKPFYQSFQDDTDKLIASFSASEREVIRNYLTKALHLTKTTLDRLK